jgi:serine/threonine protein kinase
MSDFLGTDRYELLHHLGSGGMGSVYAVRDHDRGQVLAIKVLHIRNAASIVRFKREFRAVANLRHPNLVRLYELTTYDDGLCFTMELVKGVDLLDWLSPEYQPGRKPKRARRWHEPLATSDSRQIFGAGLGEVQEDTIPALLAQPRGEAPYRFEDLARDKDKEQSHQPDVNIDQILVGMRAGSDPAARKIQQRSMSHYSLRQPPKNKPSWPIYDLRRVQSALAQIIDALEYLHERGLVHRDLKPDNILLSPEGQVKLVDFGIAKHLDEVNKLSITGGPMGTPAYIAPECAEGTRVEGAADRYSLGCLMFELFTGCRPFEGNPMELLWKHQNAPPPRLSDYVEGAPPHLERLCLALLSKSPQERPSLDQVRDVLNVNPELQAEHLFGQHAPAKQMRLTHQSEKLSMLFVRLVQAEQGHRQAVLLSTGDARRRELMVNAMVDLAQERQFLVLRSHCQPNEELPYRAFDVLLDELALAICRWPDAALISHASHIKVMAQRFASFHVIFERRWDIFGVPDEDLKGLSQSMLSRQLGKRNQLSGSLATLLCEQSKRRPLMIMLHDFHNADPDSVAMLRLLLEKTAECRLLLGAIYQHQELATLPTLRRFLNDISVQPHVLHLHQR